MINEVQEIGGIYGGKHWQCHQQHRVYGTWGVCPTVSVTATAIKILVMDEKCLTPRRNEFGRKYRKEYEQGPNRLSRHLMRNLEPRDDGITNTLTSVQKDNLLLCAEDTVIPCAIRGREDITQKAAAKNKAPQGKRYRIRKLTERECFRLMDVDEKDIDTIQAAGISRTQQYKLAGNSIVVACLYHLFRKMFVETGNEERQLTIF